MDNETGAFLRFIAIPLILVMLLEVPATVDMILHTVMPRPTINLDVVGFIYCYDGLSVRSTSEIYDSGGLSRVKNYKFVDGEKILIMT